MNDVFACLKQGASIGLVALLFTFREACRSLKSSAPRRDVHCDPHAANMLVRTDKRGRPQLVLLDHGLYKQLSEDLRLNYAGLWQALIFGDEKVESTLNAECVEVEILLPANFLSDLKAQDKRG